MRQTQARRTSNARRALSRGTGHQRRIYGAGETFSGRSGLTLTALVLRRLLLILLLLPALLARILRITRLRIGLLRIRSFSAPSFTK
ncbi:hypothetical protein LFL96_35470 (plasmid) [Paraburkholderia sp. D15]|uniref:hypothetical protein n=1 Tax=Paraburkholderia sp. D15 TaxID=2880218 RepID=UPI00247A02E2|nr:hypothetical protein [Paraburkholderia sp. D15]WGS55234.1 hypothetical protein LFL96_35470 [Paraburkholderia sp. D15]